MKKQSKLTDARAGTTSVDSVVVSSNVGDFASVDCKVARSRKRHVG